MSARLVMKLEVVEVHELSALVRRYVLRHPRRPLLPPPEPGSHVDVRLPDGRIRQYSLCGDPADQTRFSFAVQRQDEGRGGSAWLHAHLQPGAIVPVSAPRNHFALADEAPHHVLIGGGIGITPVVAMAWQLQRRGASFQVHVLARDRSQAPFWDELLERHGDRVKLHLSDDPARPRLDVHAELQAAVPATHVYACGPRRLIVDVRDATADWPEARVHVESFVPLADGDRPRDAFELLLARSGRVLQVSAQRSALAVLQEAGCLVPQSCGIGVCGSCECAVLGGEVQHRDVVLDGAARSRAMLPCVSRGVGRVTLDL